MFAIDRLPRSAAFLTLLLGLSQATTAWAHPVVDRGRQEASDAYFEDALSAFAEAEERDDLSREDLVLLLESRAYVHFAMGNQAALETDVRRLASLVQDHAFDVIVPPEVQELYRSTVASSEGLLRVHVEVTDLAGTGVQIRAVEEHDTGGLVRAVVVRGRAPDGPWSEAEGTLSVPLERTASLHYFVEAVGPGGAVVARQGSREAPEVHSPAGPGPLDAGHDDSGVPTWAWVAGGAGLAVAVIVTIVLVSTGDGLSDQTQPTGPMVNP